MSTPLVTESPTDLSGSPSPDEVLPQRISADLLQDNPIDAPNPNDGQALVWNASSGAWIASTLFGQAGPQGASGPRGLMGMTGNTGPQGRPGIPGPTLDGFLTVAPLKYEPLSGTMSIDPLAVLAPTGSGARLTNLNPGNIAAGTAPIDISGKASGITGDINQNQVAGLSATLAAKLSVGGDVSSTTVAIAPNTIARSLAARFADAVNVLDYGCVGDGATDNAAAMRGCFLKAAANGRTIRIPSGLYLLSKPIDFLAGTTVFCEGTLKLTADPTAAGGFLLIKGGDNDVNWFGGTIDGGGLINMNGITAAFDPGNNLFSRNIKFQGVTVRNCRTNMEWDAANHFAGGGKGITCQFHADGIMFSDMTIEDCDIGISLEAANVNNQYTYNALFNNILIRRAPRCGIYLGGSIPAGVGSSDTWGSLESKIGQCVFRNVVMEDCSTEADTGLNYGAITSNFANGVDLECTVRSSNPNTNPITLWRGNAGHGRVKIRAYVDYLYDGANFNPYAGATGSTLSHVSNDFHIDLDVKNSPIGGSLFRGSGLVTRNRISAVYDLTSSPSHFTGIPTNDSNRYAFYNRRFGTYFEGSTAGSASGVPPTTAYHAYRYPVVEFANSVRFAPTSTPPASPVAGFLAISDGTAGGFDGVRGAGLYRHDGAAWKFVG